MNPLQAFLAYSIPIDVDSEDQNSIDTKFIISIWDQHNLIILFMQSLRPTYFYTGVHEVMLCGTLILHLAFFLTFFSLSFFYCYPKDHINLFLLLSR